MPADRPKCPKDDSYLLLMGGFSSDAHQTQAFTYYCVKCKFGYTHIRPFSSETDDLLQWLETGSGFKLVLESRSTAERYPPGLVEKCAATLASGVADFRIHRNCVPERCPLDSWLLPQPPESFQAGGARTIIVYFCGRCNHYHCYGTDADYGWQYLVSVTVDSSKIHYSHITAQRTTDDLAQECVRIIESVVAKKSV